MGPATELDAAALDRGDTLIPGLVRSDLRRSVAEHKRADEFRPLTIELLRDNPADRNPDDRGAGDCD